MFPRNSAAVGCGGHHLRHSNPAHAQANEQRPSKLGDVPAARVGADLSASSRSIKNCTEVVRLLEELRADVKKVKSDALAKQRDGLLCNMDDSGGFTTVLGSSQVSSGQLAAELQVQMLTTTVYELKEQIKCLGDKLCAEVTVRERQAMELSTQSADFARMHRKMCNGLLPDERQKKERFFSRPASRASCPGPKAGPLSSRLGAHKADLRHEATKSPKWPLVSVEDRALGSANASKLIRIIAPGVSEDEITIDVLPNGARVSIMSSSASESSLDLARAHFQQDFLFDVRADGILELREDECSLDRGILLLVLRHAPPRQMRWRAGVGLTTSNQFSEVYTGTPGLTASVSTSDSSPQFFAMTPAMSECDSWPTQVMYDDLGSELSSRSDCSVVTPAFPTASADFLLSA